jgi:hypothetical protein
MFYQLSVNGHISSSSVSLCQSFSPRPFVLRAYSFAPFVWFNLRATSTTTIFYSFIDLTPWNIKMAVSLGACKAAEWQCVLHVISCGPVCSNIHHMHRACDCIFLPQVTCEKLVEFKFKLFGTLPYNIHGSEFRNMGITTVHPVFMIPPLQSVIDYKQKRTYVSPCSCVFLLIILKLF